MNEDELVKRISDCQEVIEGLRDNHAWKVILGDLDRQRKVIDDNWHIITDEKKLQECRVTKFAVMHLLNLKDKYEQDLKNSQEELRVLRTPDKEIAKDYDLETKVED